MCHNPEGHGLFAVNCVILSESISNTFNLRFHVREECLLVIRLIVDQRPKTCTPKT